MTTADVMIRPLEEADLAQLVGVTMHKPDESAYHDESAWVIDDWR